MINKFNSSFVMLFGIGKFKYAPGTIASLITTLFLFFLFHVIYLSNQIVLLFLSLIFFYSFIAIEDYINKKDNKDPKEIVIDEFIGQSIPLYLYEISHGLNKQPYEAIFFYIYIFVVFRFFDIKKPFPVNFFDKNYKNSFGVMADDIIASFYTVLTLIIFMVLKSKLF